MPTPSPRVHGQQKRASTDGEVMLEVDAAFAAYNALASKHRLTVCSKLTDALRIQLGKVLHDIIGGLDGFKRALSAIPSNDYLMGRSPANPSC